MGELFFLFCFSDLYSPYIVGSDEKSYLCRRRHVLPQLQAGIKKWIPTFPAPSTKIRQTVTPKPFPGIDSIPQAKKHQQQTNTNNNFLRKKIKKNLHDFLKRSGSFFFLKLWSLQEFDPDFIFISAGFDGHEAWGGWGLVDGTRWGSESRSALDKNLRLDGGFKGFIFLPPLGGTNPIWRIFLKWVVQPPPRRLLDKMEFLGLLEIPTLLYPWRKKPCLHLHLFFQPNFTIKIGCLDPILPTKTSGWFDWLLQFEWGGVPGCIGVRDQRCHTSTWILSLKTDTW